MGILLSTLLFRKKWTDADRTASKTAGLMGFMGITEGAIPFVISDIKHVMPATMIGTAVGAVIAALGNVKSPVPHGSFITLPVIDGKVMFIVAIVVGSFVTAVLLGLFKRTIIEVKNE